MKSIWDELLNDESIFLHKLGFPRIMDDFDYKASGNSFVDLENSDMRLRLIRDRGDLIVYVMPLFEIDTQTLLEYILQILHPGFDWTAGIRDADRLHEECREIEQNYENIASLLLPDSLQMTKLQVKNLARKRLVAMGIHIK